MLNSLSNIKNLTQENLAEIIEFANEQELSNLQPLFRLADNTRREHYGKKVFMRGLIEFSSYCKNNCYYCGLRCGNLNAKRYRLEPEEIYNCCENGYKLGFRTFVLQSGEDTHFTDEKLCDIITHIKEKYPDCAVTLSLGERNFDSFAKLKQAGADRYLLRHETANEEHYKSLHPEDMPFSERLSCLYELKRLGFQVGCGYMVGSPGQTFKTLAQDLIFIREFRPHMVGIGPFIKAKNTPFAEKPSGTLKLTLIMLALTRLILPEVLLPATTALSTIDSNGRELGLKAGANVVMPNLSPTNVRKKYMLYDDKLCTGDESAECVICIENLIKNAGYDLYSDRGDSLVGANIIRPQEQ